MDFDVGPERCAGCNKIVFPPEKLTALKKTWHKWCLKCDVCKTTLSVKTVESYNNIPYCRSHMQTAKMGGGTKTMHRDESMGTIVTKDTKIEGGDQSTENQGVGVGGNVKYDQHAADQSTENDARGVGGNIKYETHSGDQSTENAPERSNITYETHAGDQSTESTAEASSITYETHAADQSTENAPDASNVTYETHAADQSTENAPDASAVTYDEPAADQSTGGAEEAGGEGEQTVALYAFEGTEGGEQELTFEEGATLWVTDKSDPDNFYYGYDENNNEGYFPGNYCQLGIDNGLE